MKDDPNRVLLLPGLGVGREVIRSARRVLEASGAPIVFETARMNEADLMGKCRRADAILAGPAGDENRGKVRALRHALGLYAELRRIRVFDAIAHLSPIRAEIISNLDLVFVREASAGMSCGQRSPRRAVDHLRYSDVEIDRVARLAMGMARRRVRRLASVDWGDLMAASALWREVVGRASVDYPDVDLSQRTVHACSARLIARPRTLDVILVGSGCGEILGHQARSLVGAPATVAGGFLGDARPGLFGPVHGPAHELASTGQANPIGAILAAAMMLRQVLNGERYAANIEAAVSSALHEHRSPDLGGSSTTDEVTGAVLRELAAINATSYADPMVRLPRAVGADSRAPLARPALRLVRE